MQPLLSQNEVGTGISVHHKGSTRLGTATRNVSTTSPRTFHEQHELWTTRYYGTIKLRLHFGTQSNTSSFVATTGSLLSLANSNLPWTLSNLLDSI